MANSAKTLTTKQVIAGFAVGHMTIYNWRKGTDKQDALPTQVNDAGKVTFNQADIVAWAKKYGRPFNVTQIDAVAETTKPGPKPKAPAPVVKTSKAPKIVVGKATVVETKPTISGMSKTGRKIVVAAKKASNKTMAKKFKTAANARLAKEFDGTGAAQPVA